MTMVQEPAGADEKKPEPGNGRDRHIVKTLAALLLAAVVLIVGMAIGQASNRPLTGGVASAPIPSASADANPPSVPASAQTSTPADPNSYQPGEYIPFGQAYTTPNGWKVQTSGVKSYKRSQYAAGGEGGARYVRIDVTLTNTTSRYVNPSQEWTITLGVDGARTDRIFDSGQGVGDPTTGALAPGKSVTFGEVWTLDTPPTTIQLGLDPASDQSGNSHVLFMGRV